MHMQMCNNMLLSTFFIIFIISFNSIHTKARHSRRVSDGCVYSFEVWKPNKEAERRLQDIENLCQSVRSEVTSELNGIKADMFRDLKGLYNNTMMVQRVSLEQKVQIMQLQLKFRELTSKLHGVDKSMESIDNEVLYNQAEMNRMRRRNVTLPSDIIVQMKNSMGNLKAEWLLIKRQIHNVISESYKLKLSQNEMGVERTRLYGVLNNLKNDTSYLIQVYENVVQDVEATKKSWDSTALDFSKIKDDQLECQYNLGLLKEDMDVLKNNVLSIKNELNVLKIENTNLQHDFYKLIKSPVKETAPGVVIQSPTTLPTTQPTTKTTVETPYVNKTDKPSKTMHETDPKDCHDVYTRGFHTSGAYEIRPPGAETSDRVYCEVINGCGWTIIQRRIDGLVDFNKRWLEYKYGFGNIYGEFWLGNERLHHLTKGNNYQLRVDIWDWEGKRAYALYERFMVEGEENKYRLHLGGYSGTAGDSFSAHNKNAFSTEDADNDLHVRHCAVDYKSGWWFDGCYTCNLNGIYRIGWYNKGRSNFADGIIWYTLKNDDFYSLKTVEMKIRPR